MQFILYNSPSLCLQETAPPPPSLPPCFSLTPRNVRATLKKTTQVWYVQSRYASQLSAYSTNPFQLLFQTYSRKKEQTLSVQFRQPNSGSNMSGKTAERWQYVETLWIFFMKYSPIWGRSLCCLRWQTGYHHFLFPPDLNSQYNNKKWIIVFIMLFLFLSFLSELFTEWEQRVNGGGGVLNPAG